MSKVIYYPKSGEQCQVNGKLFTSKGVEFDSSVAELEVFVKMGILTTIKPEEKKAKEVKPEIKDEKPADAPKEVKDIKQPKKRGVKKVKADKKEEPVVEENKSGIAKIKNIFKK